MTANAAQIDWIAKEATDLFRKVEAALEQYIDDSDIEKLHKGIDSPLKELAGVFTVVGMSIASVLLDEIIESFDLLAKAESNGKEALINGLMDAVLLLPNYLAVMKVDDHEHGVALIPYVNALRSARKKKGMVIGELLPDSYLIDLDGVVLPPLKSKPPALPPVSNIRGHYTNGVLGFLRDSNDVESLKKMKAAVSAVCVTCQSSAGQVFWRMNEVVLACVITGDIRFRNDITPILGELDVLMKELGANGEEAMLNAIAPPVVKSLVWYIVSTKTDNRLALYLKKQSGFSAVVDETESLLDAIARMSSSESELYKELGAGVKAELAEATSHIETWTRGEGANPEMAAYIAERILMTSGAVSLIGEKELGESMRDMVARLHEEASGGAALSSDERDTVVELILRAHELFGETDVDGNSTEDQGGMIETTAKAALADLHHISTLIENSVEKQSVADNRVPAELSRLANVLAVLSSYQLVGALHSLYLFSSQLIKEKTVINAEQLDLIADVLTVVEHHLSAMVEDFIPDPQAIEIAALALDKLGVPLTEFDPHTPVIDEMIEEKPAAVPQEEVHSPADGMLENHEEETVVPALTNEPPVPEQPVEAEEGKPSTGGFMMKDEDEEILEIFLEEAGECVDAIRAGIEGLEANNDTVINDVRRAFHTLKGSGRIVGLDRIGDYAWALEEMLNKVISGNITLDSEVIKAVQIGAEGVPQIVEDLRTGSHTEWPEKLAEAAKAITVGENPEWPVIGTDSVDDEVATGEGQSATEVVESIEQTEVETPAPVEEVIMESIDVEPAEADIVMTGPAPSVDDENELAEEAVVESVIEFSVDPSVPAETDVSGGEEDFAKALLNMFKQEAKRYLDEVTGRLTEYRNGRHGHFDIEATIRNLHSIKGSARAADVCPIAKTVSEYEKLYNTIESLNVKPTVPILDATLAMLAVIDPVLPVADPDMVIPEQEDLIGVATSYINELLNDTVPVDIEDVNEVSDEVAVEEVISETEVIEAEIESEDGVVVLAAIDESEAPQPTGELAEELPPTDVSEESPEEPDEAPAVMAAISEVESEAFELSASDIEGESFVVDEIDYDSVEPVEEEDEVEASLEVESEAPAIIVAVEEGEDNDEPDFDMELFTEVFAEEAAELCEVLASSISSLQSNPEDKEVLLEMQRTIHTIKGGARMCGLGPIGDTSHYLESILERVPQGTFTPNRELADLCARYYDVITDMLDEANDSRLAPVDQELCEVLRQAECNGVVTSELMTAATSSQAIAEQEEATTTETLVETVEGEAAEEFGDEVPVLDDVFDEALIEQVVTDEPALEESPVEAAIAAEQPIEELVVQPLVVEEKATPEAVKPVGSDTETEKPAIPSPLAKIAQPKKIANDKKVEQMRVRLDVITDISDIAGELIVSRSRVEQQQLRLSHGITEMSEILNRLAERMRNFSIDTESRIKSTSDRINANRDDGFDALEMDEFSELQVSARTMSEMVDDAISLKDTLEELEHESESLLLQQSRLHGDLQSSLVRVRLVPFMTQVPRFAKMVRKVTGELGKKIDFVTSGEEEEIDRTILERIVGPMEHLLRNAIDHGIESAEDRASAGKQEMGQIRLHVQKSGGDVLISVTDDGRGLNLDKIRQKAIALGLAANNDQISDKEASQFILHPGFSTAEKLSQISGRGVGMDVVNNEIRMLGGHLTINSKFGEGTEFLIRLPLSMTVNRALLVTLGGYSYAIPIELIDHFDYAYNETLKPLHGNPDLLYENNRISYEFCYMGDLLGIGEAFIPEGKEKAPLIMVRAGDRRLALQADTLIGSREIVIKPLSKQFGNVVGVSGAAIMGDGKIVLVADLPALSRLNVSRKRITQQSNQKATKRRTSKGLVMVVDDSVVVRKVSQKALVRNGYEVLLAKDGLDAYNQLHSNLVEKPEVMLLDIEMPNMDGFELASKLMGSDDYSDINIIMITSRSGDKHRNRALGIGVKRYMNKPFNEEQLMEAIRELQAERDTV